MKLNWKTKILNEGRSDRMLNYTIHKDYEPVLVLEKENQELREENALLKGILSDYRNGLIGTNKRLEVKKTINEKVKEKQAVSGKTPLPLWSLTGAEREVLFILLAAKENAISRSDLALKMWGNNDDSIHMSRLSTISRNLRTKLEIEKGEQDVIRTVWGKGYQLTKAFFDYYKIDSQLLKDLDKAQ